jgi:hypothetical protein
MMPTGNLSTPSQAETPCVIDGNKHKTKPYTNYNQSPQRAGVLVIEKFVKN